MFGVCLCMKDFIHCKGCKTDIPEPESFSAYMKVWKSSPFPRVEMSSPFPCVDMCSPFPCVEMGWTYSENEGQPVDQAMPRMATQERGMTQRTTKQKVAGGHRRDRGNHLEQDSIEQMEWRALMRATSCSGWTANGGLHPAVDGQLVEGYILQWMDS